MKSPTLAYLLINSGQKLKKTIKSENESNVPFSLLSQLIKGGKTSNELTELMQCSKQEVSRQIKRAQEKQWITVEPCPNDGRAKIIKLSSSGQSLIAQGFDYYLQLEKDWEESLGKEKVEKLKSLLTDLNNIL